jgi:hypothetical protein
MAVMGHSRKRMYEVTTPSLVPYLDLSHAALDFLSFKYNFNSSINGLLEARNPWFIASVTGFIQSSRFMPNRHHQFVLQVQSKHA